MRALKIVIAALAGIFTALSYEPSFCAEAGTKEFIPQGTAIEIFYSHDSTKDVDQKFRGPDYTLGTGQEDFPQEYFPREDFPYYVFYTNVAKTVGTGYPPKIGEIVFTHFSYIDAYSGKILTDAEAESQGLITARYHKVSLPKVTGATSKFISAEKALDYIYNLPEIKFLERKYELEVSLSVEEPPRQDFPFYKIKYYATDKIKRAPGSFVNSLFAQDFYVQAYDGKVYFDENVRKNILSMMQEEKIELAKEPELKKADQAFEKQMQEAFTEINYLGGTFGSQSTQYKDTFTKSLPLFLKGLQAHTADTRSAAIRILANFARHDVGFGQYKAREAIPRLCELLKDADYGVRYEAADALGYIAEPGEEEVMASLRALINDPNSLVGSASIKALGRLKDMTSIPRFIELLDDVNVNGAILEALAELKDKRAVEPLIGLLNNKDFSQSGIIETLGVIGDKKAIPVLVSLLNKKYPPDERLAKPPFERYMGADVAGALAAIGTDSLPYLFESLKSQDYLERLYAVCALGLIKDAASIEPLSGALAKEENQTVKAYLEEAIAEIKGEKFISPLSRNLKVQVEPHKNKYMPGEQITVSLNLQNTGKEPIVVNTGCLFITVSFEIIGPDGKPVEYIGPEYCWTCTQSLVILDAQKSQGVNFSNLQSHYAFDKPGLYKVIGIYANRVSGIEFGVYALTDEVRSEPAVIEISWNPFR